MISTTGGGTRVLNPVSNLSNVFNAQTSLLSITIATGLVFYGGGVVFHFNIGAWVSNGGGYSLTLDCINASNVTIVSVAIPGWYNTGVHYHLSRSYYYPSLPAGTYKLNIRRSSTRVIMDVNNYINVVTQEVS